MKTSRWLWLGLAAALVGCNAVDAAKDALEDGGLILDPDRNPKPDAPTRAPMPVDEPVECGGMTCKAVMVGSSILPACCTPTNACGVDTTLLAEAGAPFSGCVAIGQGGGADGLCPNVTVEVAEKDVELTGCCRTNKACGVLADDLSLAGMQSVEIGLGCVAPPGATTSLPCGTPVDPGTPTEEKPPVVTPDQEITATIGIAGGTVSLTGKASVVIQADALEADTEIKIAEVDAKTIRELPSILKRIGKPFAFTPHGTTFALPSTIKLNYSGSAVGLMVAKLDDENDRIWGLIPARFRDGEAVVITDSFSIYSLAACVDPSRCSGLLRQTNCDAAPDDEVNDFDLDGTANACDACRNDPDKIEVGECGCGVSDADRDFDDTPDCFDGCDDDAAKTAAGICGCGLTEADYDQDLVPDCIDQCPEDAAKVEPGACGCGNPDTDSDNDYTANCNDECPNDADKITPMTCGCGISESDADQDGTPDCNDQCPQDANKTVPGDCGCGISEGDSDNDGARDCDDECRFDTNKLLVGVCGCGVADTDTDGDGTADCVDQCPDDANKTHPMLCGCGRSEADRDSDGALDCIDQCPDDENKTSPMICGCGASEVLDDADGDGQPECLDECPADPNKTVRGICPCGIVDDPADNDGDGAIDCEDACDVDPLKTSGGVCGCNIADPPPNANPLDFDADIDGTTDCLDACPSDPNKAIDEGLCGCNVTDDATDTDGDGLEDCNDSCPNDAAKILPGICGCGATDDPADYDGDGIPNCVDLCNGNNWFGDTNPQDGVCDKPPPTPTCQSNQLECDGNLNQPCEVDKLTDNNNCGACGVKCGIGGACTNGACMSSIVLMTINGDAASTTTQAVELYLRPNGNLVTNAYADQSFTGYQVFSTGNGWAVGGGGPFTPSLFIGSYNYEEFSQIVDLTSVIDTASLDTQTVPVRVGTWCSGNNWAADRTLVRVDFMDANNGVLNTRTLFDQSLAAGTWAFRGGLISDYPVGTRKVRITMGSDDGEYWSGHYGAIFDAVTVAVGDREMRFSDDGVTWTAWEPWTDKKAWNLPSAAKTNYTVYVQMRDPLTPTTILTSSDVITLN